MNIAMLLNLAGIDKEMLEEGAKTIQHLSALPELLNKLINQQALIIDKLIALDARLTHINGGDDDGRIATDGGFNRGADRAANG